ncbi:hypothetical protein BH09SUM1_BH09SUM1_11570 [soil metagenome]
MLGKFHRTVALREVSYGGGDSISAWGMIRSNLNFPAKFRQNQKRLGELMDEFKPDLVVADSDFYCLAPAKKRGLRLASINNSAVVVETIMREGGMPRSCSVSYNFIERIDYLLQWRYPDRVLCPTLRKINRLPEKFVQIPPIVRPAIQPLTEPGDEIVVMTGGSGIGVANIDLRALAGEKIRLLGTPLKKVPHGSNHVGFTLDVMEHFRRAKVLVVQGGFSSVSEAVALRVPTVVLPIANQAEQWTNGRAVEKLGFGLSARHAGEAGALVKKILGDYHRYWNAAQSLRIPTNGHQIAANLLWKWAKGEYSAAEAEYFQ